MPTYPTIELSKRDLQKYVDTVQQAAAVLNSVGLDVTRTMDNMRDINRALPKYFK